MYLNPSQIAEGYVEIGKKKATAPAYRLIILGILAGAFVAFASEGSDVAIHTITSVVDYFRL